MNDPILIASPPRSGSSLVSYIFKELGVFCGETKEGDQYNRLGYFENKRITKIIIDILRENDLGLGKKFHPIDRDYYYPEFKNKVQRAIIKDGLKKEQSWFFKDPKIIFTWKLWNEHFPSAKWVLLNRDINQVLKSYIKTPFMDSYQRVDQWRSYLSYFYSNMLSISNNCDVLNINTNYIINKNFIELEQVCIKLGIKFNRYIINNCVKLHLWGK